MGNYSLSDLVNSEKLDLDQIVAALEDDLPSRTEVNQSGTDYSVASATPIPIVTKTITINSDEFADVIAQVAFSGGTVNDRAIFAITADGTTIADGFEKIEVSDSGGGRQFMTIAGVYNADAQGSKDIVLTMARESGSGTIYTEDESLHITIHKKRA